MKGISIKDKFFIAGSRGMVGSSICRKLKESGYGLAKNGGILLTPDRTELNLLNFSDVDKWFKENKPDIVILAAAKVGGIFANQESPADFILENLKIQTNVIEASWKNKIKRFLFLGSSCIYPRDTKQPIQEGYLLDGLLESTNESYAIAKISGLKLCEALRRQYGFDAISLMPTNLYGPNDNYHPNNSHVMAALIKKFCEAKNQSKNKVICWGTGSPLREFMHVDDLSSASIFVLEKWFPAKFNTKVDDIEASLCYLNVGTGMDISILELAKKIANLTGYEGEIIWDKSKPDGTPKKQLDISRIKKLGWMPKINLDYGIMQTIKDYTQKYT